MAMTYAELKTNVQDITEMTFTDAQLDMFTKQAEEKMYGYIKGLPLLRKEETFASINPVNPVVLPTDCVYVHSVFVQVSDRGGTYNFPLLNKSIDFLDAAYPLETQAPATSVAGVLDARTADRITYYAVANLSDESSNSFGAALELRFAPKYNMTASAVTVQYHFRPRSITEALGGKEEVWLGQNYDSALLNGVLVEAARFMKAEPDIQAMYKEQYIMAMTQLTDTVNTRMRSDSFRPQSPAAGPMPPSVPSEPE